MTRVLTHLLVGRWPVRLGLACGIAVTAAIVGCDGTNPAAADISAQMSTFVQDFARQALAAWLL